ncbi:MULTISPECIES: ABC transporter substrate-binding protein [Sutcliffiella]|uniref:SgrR family transcriptional regulator n=1 Tax=Sutcliffiella cohnii TaxID=33932 RepID=A0A223KNJ8_9BACI|nr:MULTISPECIES: ABC transporter substrate-binding protein [Sutcliffiella]AST90913.1 hypothetical protein BC6307_06265 [Sutcliffiella cohnii]WBL16701.1 ABC transporter substrate-binding protein [Sutcliffiella sp. NC1]
MKLIEHYVLLRSAFSQVKEGEMVEAMTEEISSILSCTFRNAQLLLKRMEQEQWITWKSRRGRGRKATLSFHLSLRDSALTRLKELIDKQNIQACLDYIHHTNLPTSIREELTLYLKNYFGYKQDSSGRNDMLRLPLKQEIYTLDPSLVSTADEAHLVTQIFDPLVIYHEKNQTFEPHLVYGWKVKDDGKRWIFYIQKGIVFHNGRTLCAKDVIYTFSRLKDGSGNYPYFFQHILEIKEINELVLEITFSQPTYQFLHHIGSFYASILPYDIGFIEESPIGTGPFKVEMRNENIVRLEANLAYFQGRPFLDKVELLKTEMDIHMLDTLEKKADFDTSSSIEFIEKGSNFLLVNLQKVGPLQNRENREVLYALVDQRADDS